MESAMERIERVIEGEEETGEEADTGSIYERKNS